MFEKSRYLLTTLRERTICFFVSHIWRDRGFSYVSSNFAREIGPRPAKIYPLAHALRLTAVLPSGLMLMDKSMQKKTGANKTNYNDSSEC